MEQTFKSLRDDERRIGEEYLSSLTDLNCNSKPLINMLTMLAEENINYAHVIVRVVEYHISQVQPEFKLPILYLIDSIIKNVKSSYVQLFGQCIVNIFLHAFESVQHSQSQVLEKVRERMYALRQTWNEVFPPSKLYTLDVKVKRLDNNWPITAKQPPKIHVNPAIHVNPDFLKTGIVPMPVNSTLASDMEEILQAKTRELLELKKRKLELELEQTKKHLEEQERLSQVTDVIGVVPNALPVDPIVALRPPGLEDRLPPAALRAGGGTMFNAGIRHMQPGATVPPMLPVLPTSQQSFAAQVPTAKTKVHPVNAALLNSVRQRDPRLARQQPQQMAMPAVLHRSDPRLDNKSVHKSSRSRSKSPARPSGINDRSSKSSSSSSSRKRSESKSSSSSSSSDRRKGGSNSGSSSSPAKRSSRDKRNDKESHDRYSSPNATTTGKRKSSPTAESPSSKSKRTQETQKSRSSKSKSTRSRSRSPTCRDVDMRSVHLKSKSPEPPIANAEIKISNSNVKAANDLDKHQFNILELGPGQKVAALIKTLSMDIDLRPIVTSSISSISMPQPPPPPAFPKNVLDITTAGATATINNTTTTPSSFSNNSFGIATATTSSKLPTKVSFKIQKPLNKLEKSTANLSTALLQATSTSSNSSNSKPSPLPSSSSSLSASAASAQGNVSNSLKESISKLMQTVYVQGAVAEKRSATVIADQQIDTQPQQKRSKSAKLDALFGSEDVDLRMELPISSVKPLVAPIIIVEDDSMENWEEVKETPAVQRPRKATLDELRAKLVKTVRNNNKMSKAGPTMKDSTQRLKQLIAELKGNEDSQEAYDEKVRTILSQAQEMYDNNAMNQEQYKDLVQKMAAITDTNKQKESKRWEAALAHDDEDLSHGQRERNAARNAVLKKRIPKLKGNELSPRREGSPRYDEPAAEERPSQSQKQKNKRENKRRKPSKWGDPVDNGNAQRAAWQLANCNNNNKRGASGFRGNVGPGMTQNNMRMPVAAPWQQPFNSIPSMLVAAAAPPTAALPNIIVPTEVAGFNNIGNNIPPPPQPPSMIAMPPVPPALTKAINSLDNPMVDVVRSITIDGGSKEIRFYNQVAIIFMDGDEPHEIGFQNGQRAVCIDHNEPLPLSFNDDYKPITIDGQLHRIRFGFPSRELYIDEHWYEIYFGGPPVSLPIGNKLHVLKAEGPPPNVDIGRVRRDLVVGKINMIIDALTIVPLFLDAKVQMFKLGAEQHQLQFVDGFLYVLMDGQLQKVEYGGLPKSMNLNGRTCFIRFGILPKGVMAGKTHVQDMVYIKTEPPAEPPKPPVNQTDAVPVVESAASVTLPAAAAALGNLNIDELFQKLVSSGIIGTTATAASTVKPQAATDSTKDVDTATKAPAVAEPTVPAALPAEPIKRIDLNKPETIKTRQSAVVAALYLGMQCSSCGVRFPPEQTIKYSQHLDWHFRQNRRDRDTTRKATSHKWYYDLNDWMQYEEIEDVEEREKNFLESQQLVPDALDELSNQRSMDSPTPSCAAGADDVDRACDMCHEKFEQFYNEELEEWHLRSAIRVDDKIYHPLCYEDYKASLNPPVKVANPPSDVDMNNTDDNAMDTIIKIENGDDNDEQIVTSKYLDEDDDDVIVLPNEEPSVTEIVDDDDDEYVPVNITREEMGADSPQNGDEQRKLQPQNSHNESATESDVEIQEPNIPFTDLDTYVEKELPPMDEATQAALLNVKIKEEPKDEDYDEDDGFEDVGTVVPQPPPIDEISINSSETQTQTIASSASPATLERPPSVASLNLPSNEAELELEPVHEATSLDLNSSIDGNGEPQETHNLSAAGPAPALPLASIVNKIKINMAKNTSSKSSNSVTNANNSANISTTTTTTTATIPTTAPSADLKISAISVIGSNTEGLGQVNAIQTISTIPVLCSNNTFVPKIQSNSPCLNVPANISSISVIGSSYGNNNSSRFPKPQTVAAAPVASSSSTVPPSTVVATPTTIVSNKPKSPPTVEPEPEPEVELKPALREVTLKKTKKVQSGVETSGLCSIM